MRRSRTLLAVSVSLFCLAEILLGIRFQTNGDHGALLRYITVILACLFCILFAERSWEYLFTQAALLLTVCADWFLVLPSYPNQLPGMLFFSVAQLAYAARLYLAEKRPAYRRWQIPVRVILSAAALLATALVLGRGTDAVALVSLFYYANLLMNILFAWMQAPTQTLMAAGLTLFILCDTLVGLAFLDGYFTIPEGSMLDAVIHPGFDLAWAFYLPSQMLLGISLLPGIWKKAVVSSPSNESDSSVERKLT